MSSNNKKNQLAFADLSNFLNTCQNIGVKPDDFGMLMHTIVDHVIDAADEDSPTRELKKPLLFLRALQTFLNDLTVN